jgi:hypothetical protein
MSIDEKAMNKIVQFIDAPDGGRMVVLPEAEYRRLLDAATPIVVDPEEGELKPEFVRLLMERDASLAAGNFVVYDPVAKTMR